PTSTKTSARPPMLECGSNASTATISRAHPYRLRMSARIPLLLLLILSAAAAVQAQQKARKGKAAGAPSASAAPNPLDARNRSTNRPQQPQDPEFARYGIYEQSAPRATKTAAIQTTLPLQLNPGDRIALIGNTLFER